VGGLTPSLSFDSRDNIFTPNKGTYAELQSGVFRQCLGTPLMGAIRPTLA
jgi:hypothetical protein